MIYHFLDDQSGQVIAEARSDEVDPFLNHRYPASDIPQQASELHPRKPPRATHGGRRAPARVPHPPPPGSGPPQHARALSLRVPLRVIHDVSYTPAPLRGGDGPLDL